MNKNNWLIRSFLLLSVVGALGLTTANYVGCEDFDADEFLDLGLLCQHPILPILTPHLKTYPSNPSFVKISDFEKPELLSTVLRC